MVKRKNHKQLQQQAASFFLIVSWKQKIVFFSDRATNCFFLCSHFLRVEHVSFSIPQFSNKQMYLINSNTIRVLTMNNW